MPPITRFTAKILLLALALSGPLLGQVPRAGAAPLAKRPRLIVVLVIDQFRADYLTRFESRFLPPKGAGGSLGGFRYLMSSGAYYPFGEYEILQNMTGPGHATVLTGSYPYQNGIALNHWYDRGTNAHVYTVDDPQYGTSPRLLIGTTLGDELKNAGYPSRVVGLALKDRAAILMAGHRADLAFWYDPASQQWASSRYYLPDGKLPGWLSKLNDELHSREGTPLVWASPGGQAAGYTDPSFAPDASRSRYKFSAAFPHETKIGSKETTSFPYGLEITESAAERVIDELGMGRGKATDLLAVSFSTHDYAGHYFGPHSPEMEEMTVAEDRVISKFLNFVRRRVPLEDAVFVLTADHGVAPNPDWSKLHKIDAGRISEEELLGRMEERLNAKFGKPKKGSWFAWARELNFFLNPATLSERGAGQAEVEREAKKAIEATPGLAWAFSSTDYFERKLPPGMVGEAILKSYFPGRSGDLIVIPRPFWTFVDDSPVNHFTHYSYDRMVPIVLSGPAFFRSGVYTDGKVVDIAPTLAFISGSLPPALSEGRVLSEAIRGAASAGGPKK